MGRVAFDPFSEDVLADPNAAYDRLRTTCPVHQFEGFDPPFYTMTRFDDVMSMLPRLGAVVEPPGLDQVRASHRQGGLFDPPDTFFRKLIQSAFSARHRGGDGGRRPPVVPRAGGRRHCR